MEQTMEQHLTVKRTGEFEYQIRWEHDFSKLPEQLEALALSAKKVCIVTDNTVGPLFATDVEQVLAKVFDVTTIFSFSAGEQHKTLDTVRSLYTHLIENQFGRKDILIALGGGVVGDLTGFAAATYLRGVDFIQIPTTTLSQVDSSIGGKTGVDFDQFKNMVGAFHQPRLVYMNLSVLQTLPDEQFCCGIAEMLKSGLIKDSNYFKWMADSSDAVLKRQPDVLLPMIQKSCEIKKFVVENDPTEQGERALLNLGHTIGHAIEKLMDFQLFHGQCVALGTVAAAYLSYKRGYLSIDDLQTIEVTHQRYQLPIRIKGLQANNILATTKSDKKMEQGKIKFILLSSIGNAVIDNNVSDGELLDAIAYIMED